MGTNKPYDGSSANNFVVKDAPATVRYIPNFITPEEEEYLIAQIDSAPTPKWQVLRDRRVQSWGGVVGKFGLIPDGVLPKWLEDIVSKLMAVPDVFPDSSRPNHVLINDYHPGNGIMSFPPMIMPFLKRRRNECVLLVKKKIFYEHTDGPAYYPLVATISLGSGLMIDYTRGIDPDVITFTATEGFNDRYIGSLFLEARSLVLLSDVMFTSYLHGIANRTVDVITKETFNRDTVGKEVGTVIPRTRRISLTVRNVPKVRRSVASFLKKN
ncbi:unnamed protein product [Enterobius vermicularis]|uniref:Fe2OG dioxygenase domain-containing protein n=1 Tax=Enterobius vermicularis TaxID=51028 RepID=A0A0N4V7V7_ENTVE|nr:unnamed protein product [Enterobius vermicularis]